MSSLAEGSGKALLFETRINAVMEGAVTCVASKAVLGLAVRGIVAGKVESKQIQRETTLHRFPLRLAPAEVFGTFGGLR